MHTNSVTLLRFSDVMFELIGSLRFNCCCLYVLLWGNVVLEYFGRVSMPGEFAGETRVGALHTFVTPIVL